MGRLAEESSRYLVPDTYQDEDGNLVSRQIAAKRSQDIDVKKSIGATMMSKLKQLSVGCIIIQDPYGDAIFGDQKK